MSLFVAHRLGAAGFDASPPNPDFTLEFSKLLDRFGYKERFGISLLHRHWESPGEVMVERPAGPNSRPLRPPSGATPHPSGAAPGRRPGPEMRGCNRS